LIGLIRKIKKFGAFLNRLDAIDRNKQHQRERIKVERKHEVDENFASELRRFEHIAKGRHLYRNFPLCKSLMKQLRWNVIGNGPELIARSQDTEWNKKVEVFFNSQFSREADDINNRNLHDLNGIALINMFLTGDLVQWFNEDSGKLRFFEADQITEMIVNDFDEWKLEQQAMDETGNLDIDSIIQDRGVVIDEATSKTLGFFVTRLIGQTPVKREDVTFFPSTESTMLVDPYRPNMKRGISDVITSANLMQDLHEMRVAELGKAKTQANVIGVVKSDISEEIAQSRRQREPITEIEEQQNEENDGTEGRATNDRYDNFEEILGNRVEYLNENENLELLETKSPPPDYVNFYNHGQDSVGASFGLSPFHTRLTTNTSFSAARAEIIIGKVTFQIYQKFAERYIYDWQVEKAISWGMRQGRIPSKAREDWFGMWSFSFPELDAIDEFKKVRATSEALKTRQIDYEDLHGPDWKEKFQRIQEQEKEAGRLGIKLNLIKEDAVVSERELENLAEDVNDLMAQQEARGE